MNARENALPRAAPPRLNVAEEPAPKPPASAAPWRIVVALALVAAIAVLLWLELWNAKWEPRPIGYGFAAVALLYLLSVWITGRAGPLQAAMGTDGRLSTSKFQFLLWTAVVVFTYAWLYAARAQNGHTAAINDLPANVLLAMGISVGTLATAKAITTSYLRSGLIDKPAQSAENARMTDLVANDNEAPDLTKIQMLVWTFIAAAVYLVQVAIAWKEYAGCVPPVRGDLPVSCRFPDIDAALMVLMGLGQGAYLGNKLVTVNTPRIGNSVPLSGAWGTEVTLNGQAFGASPDGQWVTLDDRPIPVAAADWTDTAIKFRVPRKRPSDGGDWRFHETAQIGLVVNGRRGAGVAPFQIAPPRIDSLEPAGGPRGTAITLRGSAFGREQDDSEILLNGAPSGVRASRWTDTEITFTLPAMAAAGAVRVGIRIYGEAAPSEKVFTVAA